MENTLILTEDTIKDEFSLEAIARIGAQEMLKVALEAEIKSYLECHSGNKTEDGKSVIVRNGYHKSRTIATASGEIEVSVPRTRNRSGNEENFISAIVPKYMRRSLKLNEAIPLLYLKGISTNNMEESLKKLFGDNISGLSAATITRLKKCWEEEYEKWSKRSFENKKYCYVYADGLHLSVRFSEKKLCLLVIIGVLEDGNKELITINSGYRESTDDWKEILLNLKSRKMKAPALAIGDGALGFQNALLDVFPETNFQRCWVHKKRNVLNKMPKSLQKEASKMIDDIYLAEKKENAEKAFSDFEKRFSETQYNAVKCLCSGKENLLMFYNYPKQHWRHIRTTNPIESMFSTVRLRTKSTRGMGTEKTTFSMVFKLAEMASNRWSKIWGHNIIQLVLEGKKFENGEEVKTAA